MDIINYFIVIKIKLKYVYASLTYHASYCFYNIIKQSINMKRHLNAYI